ncbi:MAG TPA: hypothetical protein DHF18_04795 [Ruminococcaceae bacterium]|nr:hypothetical protein [Oscillospiraceae bacterium]
MKNELPGYCRELAKKVTPARGFAVGRSFVFDKMRGIAMPSVRKTYSAPPTSKWRQISDP